MAARPLSISIAWDETAALAKRRWTLLFPLAFLFLSLPPAVVQAVAPVIAPGDPPTAGLWLALTPLVAIAALVGALAISLLALRPEAAAGEVLAGAAKRLLPLLGAAALLFLILLVLLVPVSLLALVSAGWGLLLAFPLFLFVGARLLVATPVAAGEALGPIAILSRAWRLTRGQLWRLAGFLALVGLVSVVVLMATGAVAGIIIVLALGDPQPGSLALLAILAVSALVQALVSGLFTAFVARIYAQLAQSSNGS